VADPAGELLARAPSLDDEGAESLMVMGSLLGRAAGWAGRSSWYFVAAWVISLTGFLSVVSVLGLPA
jgi:hypothetical protein